MVLGGSFFNGIFPLDFTGGDSSVHMILRNESYKGTYTWGKTDQRLRTQRTMNTRVVDRAESEWVVIENHHEAIIAPEVFDKVQEL